MPGPATGGRTVGRRLGLASAAVAAVIVVVGLVILSPVALRAVSGGAAEDWSRLSDVGQTYGAASAVLSALALGGVAASLLLQARQSRAERIQAIRGFHTDLITMQLDDLPVYLPCWGPLDLPDDTARRQHIYTNLLMQYAWMGYEIGTIPEPLLRDMLAGMFRGDVASRFWPMARASWTASTAGTRRGRRFLLIVDEEYARSAPVGPVVREAVSDGRPGTARGPAPVLGYVVLGVAASVSAGLVWRRRRSARTRAGRPGA
ncbi:DUF6082 family protein [Micromonospora maritima]|uniref:DUF6082 family protein n=1 Tax=Micromonospora maritima TaxID=986711 RepID=UPI00378B86BD